MAGQWRVVFEDQCAFHRIDSQSVQLWKPTDIFSVGDCIAKLDEGEVLSRMVCALSEEQQFTIAAAILYRCNQLAPAQPRS